MALTKRDCSAVLCYCAVGSSEPILSWVKSLHKFSEDEELAKFQDNVVYKNKLLPLSGSCFTISDMFQLNPPSYPYHHKVAI